MKKINIDSIIGDFLKEEVINNVLGHIKISYVDGINSLKDFLNTEKIDEKKFVRNLILGKISKEHLEELGKKLEKENEKLKKENKKLKKEVNLDSLGLHLYSFIREKLGVDFLNLFKKNGILVCPYCNINKFELLLDKDKKTLIPSLDHIENKAKNGFLSYINIKNLIPSCDTCNSRFKGSKKLSNECNPYNGDLKDKFKFKLDFGNIPINSGVDIKNIDIKYETLSEEVKIYLDGKEKTNNNQEFSFYIKQRIQNYKFEAENFIWESNMVHNYLFKEKVLDRLSNKDYIFYDKKIKKIESIHEIPLSKLYLDIYEQYFK